MPPFKCKQDGSHIRQQWQRVGGQLPLTSYHLALSLTSMVHLLQLPDPDCCVDVATTETTARELI